MKLITFTIPCYNSAAYMRTCIDSILVGKDDVEIIIVNDGSKDETIDIANEYALKYPTICKVVDKPNGGHGSAVNAGIKNATGLYFKVVDSDDWLDKDAVLELISTIKEHLKNNEEADLYITNFVYNHVSDNTQYVSEYHKNFPVRKMFSWNDAKKLRLWKMLLMHSLLYKTEKLRASGVVLPEHTFYVDNIFAYTPLPLMEKIYYLDVNLYYYYIGRADQSVTINNVVNRYDQQVRVMKQMLNDYTYDEIKKMNKNLRGIMIHALYAIMNNTIFFTTAKDSPERREAYDSLWSELKARDPKMYRKLKYRTSLAVFNGMTWRLKGIVTTASYKFLCKYVKLGA